MAAATDQQVQQYVNERLRVRAEQFRALAISCADDKAALNDVYDACEPANEATWTDDRNDGPPRLLTAQDVLVYNTMLTVFAKVIAGTASEAEVIEFGVNWATFQSACVRPVGA